MKLIVQQSFSIRFFRKIILLTFLVLTVISCADKIEVKENINWSDFMSRHDMVWERLPLEFREAPWTGNGLIGSMVWYEKERNMIRMQVFRSDVHDHGPFTQGNAGVVRGRFQIGSFYLKPVGRISGCNLKLKIWDAKLEGSIITDKGEIVIKHFTHTSDPVISTTIEPSEGEKRCQWIWEPAKAATTRSNYAATTERIKPVRKGYRSQGNWITEVYDPEANGAPEISTIDDINFCRQTLKYGGEYSTAWKEIKNESQRTLLVSIAKKYPKEKENSAEEAAYNIAAVKSRTDTGFQKWEKEHTDWWHNYYQRSFVSLNDTRVETVYWTQIYKMACTTRYDLPMMDTAGLWQTPSPWPYITWDLNVQLCYWLPVASNHIETIGVSLINHLDKWKENLIKNVEPVEWQDDAAFVPVSTAMDCYQPRFVDGRFYSAETGGNLTWAMHNCYMMYEATQNKEMLRKQIFPLLKRAVNYQFHIMHKWDDGTYGFVQTGCPEFGSADNCNYELSIFRWGCQTLLEICDILKIDDPLIPKWEDALNNLVAYPYDDETGYRVGTDRAFDKGHRHYSHLLQIYPFYLVNIEQEGEQERIKISIDHFFETNYEAYKRTGQWGVLAGYSRTGLSSMNAAIGNGEDALLHLNEFIDYNHKIVLPNGLYCESGPVLETPLSAGQSVLDMLIQSWGDKIRIFPSLPKEWTDLCFDNLRTKGAFLVSAKRNNGNTEFVKIKSLAGESCKLKIDFVPVQSDRLIDLGKGIYQLNIDKDEEIIIQNSKLGKTELVILPIAAQNERINWFGLNKNRDQIIKTLANK
ncbi:MAG: glycoside hydrolase family 95-like protein [Bacteroidota bacterium]